MSTTNRARPRFKVGDWVSFPFGAGKAFAQVTEDRGPLGVRRRRLYGVRVEREYTEPDSFEMPEEDMEAVPPPDKAAVMQFLKEGGLVSILRSNLGVRDHPKVWLTYKPRGGITHTFLPERGVVGGAAVPYFALHEDKVFAGKQNEALTFLESFGLSRPEAKEVVAAVGTAP